MSKTSLLKEKQLVADFLNVSSRTLNRYIKKHSLTVYSYNKRKKLNLKEVLIKLNNSDLGQVGTLLDRFGQFEVDYVKKGEISSQEKAIGTRRDSLGQVGTHSTFSSKDSDLSTYVENFNRSNSEKNDSMLSSVQETLKEVEIYKNLYKETLTELKVKQERLEGATYRVGQLEAQIKNTIPLLTYRQKEEEMIQLGEVHKTEKQKQENVLKKLEKEKLEAEIIKNIYVFILFTFLILIPLSLIYYLNK